MKLHICTSILDQINLYAKQFIPQRVSMDGIDNIAQLTASSWLFPHIVTSLTYAKPKDISQLTLIMNIVLTNSHSK